MAVETLDQARMYRWKITARCAQGGRNGMKSIRECLWRYDLDIDTLMATRGGPFPLSRLAEVMICPACRSRKIVIVFEPPSNNSTIRMAG